MKLPAENKAAQSVATAAATAIPADWLADFEAAAYQRWCEENLPDWPGHGRV